MADFQFDLTPNEVTFDGFGRVIVRNTDFVDALNSFNDDSLAEATCNSGCGDTGCGNSVNGGCSSSATIYFDDWTTNENEALINNPEFTKAMLHSKLGGDLVMPMLIKRLP